LFSLLQELHGCLQ